MERLDRGARYSLRTVLSSILEIGREKGAHASGVGKELFVGAGEELLPENCSAEEAAQLTLARRSAGGSLVPTDGKHGTQWRNDSVSHNTLQKPF